MPISRTSRNRAPLTLKEASTINTKDEHIEIEHDLPQGPRPLGTAETTRESPPLHVSIPGKVHAALQEVATQRSTSVSAVAREIVSEQILAGFTWNEPAMRGSSSRKILNFRVPAAMHDAVLDAAERSGYPRGKYGTMVAAMLRDWVIQHGYPLED